MLAPRLDGASVFSYIGALDAATLGTVLANGAAYAAYNCMSFVVLSHVEMVTHAVGNAFRRVVTILCSVWYLGNRITPTNALGITVAFTGVVLYSLTKQKRLAPLPV